MRVNYDKAVEIKNLDEAAAWIRSRSNPVAKYHTGPCIAATRLVDQDVSDMAAWAWYMYKNGAVLLQRQFNDHFEYFVVKKK